MPPGPLPYADATNPQSLNKSAYTYNNPVRFIDPTGHFADGSHSAEFDGFNWIRNRLFQPPPGWWKGCPLCSVAIGHGAGSSGASGKSPEKRHDIVVAATSDVTAPSALVPGVVERTITYKVGMMVDGKFVEREGSFNMEFQETLVQGPEKPGLGGRNRDGTNYIEDNIRSVEVGGFIVNQITLVDGKQVQV